ncbi:hypothetical protein TNCV_419751 [Trichonephila clavipes]|uniref:Uncharacterized protein n=1 Tax=Trichonephila clavipes TaxID=2585209 RepID=A0A8X6S502_TRICX|nr:hypothetical protein TNCV_419751 [Trichonephila clavipes]
MSQQRDLPESMAWRVIGRLESGQTQRCFGVARSVVARLWNRFQKQKFNSPSKQAQLECYAAAKTVALGNSPNFSQTVRNRLHEGLARRPMGIPFRRRWAAEHRNGNNMTEPSAVYRRGFKCDKSN